MARKRQVFKELTTTRVLVIAMLMAGLGVCLLYLAAAKVQDPAWAVILNELGGVLIVSVALTFLWELGAKRKFLGEAMDLASLGQEVHQAGLSRITFDFYQDVPWASLLADARQVDILMGYGRTWHSNNIASIRKVARRKVKVRLVLPDPRNDQVVGNLANRFGKDAETVRDLIWETVDTFTTAFASAPNRLRIWFYDGTLVYTYYRFDSTAIVTTYRHHTEKGDVPVLEVKSDGSLFTFFSRDFENVVKGRPCVDLKKREVRNG